MKSVKKLTTLAITGLMASMLIVPTSFAGTMDGSNSRGLTVVGVGKVSVEPDTAILNLGIMNNGKTAKEAQTKNNENFKKLLGVLESKGIKKGDVQTAWYNIYPQYDYSQPGKEQINGYTANQSVNVTIRDLKTISDILDQVTTIDNIQISGVNFMVADQENTLDKAREAAAKDAEKKAGKLAKLFSAKVGKVLRVNEMGDYNSYPVPGPIPMYSESNSIKPGTIDLSIQLEVSYEIE